MKILIVDNDKKLLNSVKCEFKDARYEVHYAADGDEGLKFALEKHFDLIVLDWRLPQKDGLSVLKELREQKILTPILMLTVEDSVQDMVRSLDSGANSCVNEPFAIPVIIARMKALIRRSRWDNDLVWT